MQASWRSRFLAPVYALGIAFLLAFLGGAFLRSAAPPPEEARAVVVRLGDGAASVDPETVEITVRAADGTAVRRTAFGTDGSAEVSVPESAARVCMKLPDDDVEHCRPVVPGVDTVVLEAP